jgi:parallel beta-helix repeat protein
VVSSQPDEQGGFGAAPAIGAWFRIRDPHRSFQVTSAAYDDPIFVRGGAPADPRFAAPYGVEKNYNNWDYPPWIEAGDLITIQAPNAVGTSTLVWSPCGSNWAETWSGFPPPEGTGTSTFFTRGPVEDNMHPTYAFPDDYEAWQHWANVSFCGYPYPWHCNVFTTPTGLSFGGLCAELVTPDGQIVPLDDGEDESGSGLFGPGYVGRALSISAPTSGYLRLYLAQGFDGCYGNMNLFPIEVSVTSRQRIRVTGAPLAFGAQNTTAGATAAQTVTVLNDGAGELTFSGDGFAISGSENGQFVISNNPVLEPLGPWESRTIDVVFDPSTTGLKTATLAIASNDPGTPIVEVPLSGFAFDSNTPSVQATLIVEPPEAGTVVPAGPRTVWQGEPLGISTAEAPRQAFAGWEAQPGENAIFECRACPTTRVTLSGDATIAAVYVPLAEVSMSIEPEGGGSTSPAAGSATLLRRADNVTVSAQAADEHAFLEWRAVPPENASIDSPNVADATVTVWSDVTVTARFNQRPSISALAAPPVLSLTTPPLIATLDGTGSSDDGWPAVPGALSYHWMQVEGTHPATILEPDSVTTAVQFPSSPGHYVFRLTIDDGQLQNQSDVEVRVNPPALATVVVSALGDDDSAFGTNEDPFRTIQRGIDQAMTDGEVVVLPGTYTGPGNWGFSVTRALYVHSQDGPESCIIDGENVASGIYAGTAGAIVRGFSVRRANNYGVRCGQDARLSDCFITECDGGVHVLACGVAITNCVISNNTAPYYAGGIYIEGNNSYCRISNCHITNNRRTAVYSARMFVDIDNSLIADNDGSGLQLFFCRHHVVNCTIVSNGGGADFHSVYSDSSVFNTVIWDNPVSLGGDVSPIVMYSDIAGGAPGTGNIDVAPSFVDPIHGDYRLALDSPCIDAGHSGLVLADWADVDWDGDRGERVPIDLAGNSRFLDPPPHGGTGVAVPPTISAMVDMGAYERAEWPAAPGDLDHDGDVDVADFGLFCDCWLGPNGSVDPACNGADLNGDSYVDLCDCSGLQIGCNAGAR